MKWLEIRGKYPARWLLVEALQAHSEGEHRILEQLAVLNTYSDSGTALEKYQTLPREKPRNVRVSYGSRVSGC